MKESIHFKEISGERFLKFLNINGKSTEIGKIKSQYETQLKETHTGVGAFGLVGCNKLFGAISYGINEIKHNPGHFALLLDVVITDLNCRKLGIGSLLMAYLFSEMSLRYDYKISSFSTIAVHPAVDHYMKKLGMKKLQGLHQAPRYNINLLSTNKISDEFIKKVNLDYSLGLYNLKNTCKLCTVKGLTPKWCTDTDCNYE